MRKCHRVRKNKTFYLGTMKGLSEGQMGLALLYEALLCQGNRK